MMADIITTPDNGQVSLSAAEHTRLLELEEIIKRGLATFLEVGRALHEIRERKLYRVTHLTFAAYCHDTWGFSDSRARQLILAAATADTISSVSLPNEATLRALRQFPEYLQPTIAQIAHGQSVTWEREITAPQIKRIGEVLLQAAMTGAVDVDGEATAMDWALTEEAYEAIQRQRQHIADHVRGRPVPLYAGPCELVRLKGRLYIALPESVELPAVVESEALAMTLRTTRPPSLVDSVEGG